MEIFNAKLAQVENDAKKRIAKAVEATQDLRDLDRKVEREADIRGIKLYRLFGRSGDEYFTDKAKFSLY